MELKLAEAERTLRLLAEADVALAGAGERDVRLREEAEGALRLRELELHLRSEWITKVFTPEK